MTAELNIPPRLQSLFDVACDEIATRDQLLELEDLVGSDEPVRKLYLAYCQLHVDLHFAILGRRCQNAVREGIRAQAKEPTVSPAFGVLVPTLHDTVGFFSSGWPVAYLVATVIVGIGLLIGSLVHLSHTIQVATQSLVPSRVSVEPKTEIVGRITGMVDCKWAGTGSDSPDVPLRRKYELASGLMAITYDTGAKVILQGPVTYEVESNNGGFLTVGRLTGKVTTKNAKGFSVRTPTATVTDLGTEFGVEVNSEGATDTQVFVGKVEIAAAGSQRGGNAQTRVIQAGEYAHVGKDMTLSADERDFEVRAKRFARTMSAGLSTSDAYAELVLSMNPVVYYRMDQWPETDKKGSYVLVDSAPGGYHGVAHFDETFGKPSCRGKFGGAMSLHGSMGSEYAFVKNYPKTDNGQLSVSAWVWAVTLDPYAAIVVNWFYQPLLGQLPSVGQFGLGVNNYLGLTAQINQQDGKCVTVSEPREPLPRSQWQHVAFVADGAVLHLYRNGVEVGVTPYGGIARPPLPECLSIGCEMDKDGTRLRSVNALLWNGRLDEIAVFNHALSAEQVRQLSMGRATAASGRTSP